MSYAHASPHFRNMMVRARELLRQGFSLTMAARAVWMTPTELDLHLWNTLGRK